MNPLSAKPQKQVNLNKLKQDLRRLLSFREEIEVVIKEFSY
jgi:hypothetical protein